MVENPPTFSDRMRRSTHGLMSAIGAQLYRMGIHPDFITVLGCVLTAVAAVFIALGMLPVGGLLLLLGLPLDAVDGAVARAMHRTDRFGEMLDSSLDRYADGFIFAGLSYHFALQDAFSLMTLALAALIGSFMVSYTRARGEGVDVPVKIGLFSRLERVLVILVMLLLPAPFGLPVLEIGLIVLAVGTNLTGIQRLLYVYHALKKKHREEG